jgi:hypothetical protein
MSATMGAMSAARALAPWRIRRLPEFFPLLACASLVLNTETGNADGELAQRHGKFARGTHPQYARMSANV